MFCPWGRAPGMASVAWWFPNPHRYSSFAFPFPFPLPAAAAAAAVAMACLGWGRWLVLLKPRDEGRRRLPASLASRSGPGNRRSLGGTEAPSS